MSVVSVCLGPGPQLQIYRDIRIASEMDIRDKDQFICWMQRALDQSDESHTDDNYIELYNILLRWQIEIFCHR